MGKVINITTMTTDGVTDVKEWFVAEGDHDTAALEVWKRSAGMLTGRTTYEGFLSYWPEQQGAWAEMLNPLPKYVASRSKEGPLEWNATLIEGDVSEGVARLKQELDGDLLMSGCGELALHLIRDGLVDELWFYVHPTVWGEGARPYLGETVRMRLLEARPYDSGVVLMRYEPIT